ncbi:hypothetical protein V6S67_08790 [Arthrobacter sp. Soc17.1.1.1]|uniref:hypothetical protein n=1 Tax=Arthrobacter sp. Soc17.1.1.1 TaxID=3121277 RepID=UPI002FE4747D
MIRLIRWLLTSSIRYSYRFVRAILRLPLLLLPTPPRVRNQVAGAVAIALSGVLRSFLERSGMKLPAAAIA